LIEYCVKGVNSNKLDIQVFGAHNIESQSTKLTSFLIDEVIAIDAGGLTSSLSFKAQQQLKAILLTHQHYDHIRDVPAIGMCFRLQKSTIRICSTQPVYDALTAHLLNGKLYPNLLEHPTEEPAVKFTVIEPYQPENIEGYDVLAVPVNHRVPTVGYQVTAPDSKIMFYSGDTGPGLADCWQWVSPQLLLIECVGTNKFEDFARRVGHMTPSLLKQELVSFRELKGYLPPVVIVHMTPYLEEEIESEIAAVASELNSPITLAREGMKLHL
jgi:cAMP phosphodiesterase